MRKMKFEEYHVIIHAGAFCRGAYPFKILTGKRCNMIKKWQSVLNQVNRLIDFIIVGVSYVAATWLWLIVVRHDPTNIALNPTNLLWFSLSFALVSVFGYQLAKLYDSVRGKSFNFDVKWVLIVNAVTILGGGALFFILRLTDFSRASLALFFVLSSALVLIKR